MTQDSKKCAYRVHGKECGRPAAFAIVYDSQKISYCFAHHEHVLGLLGGAMKGTMVISIPVRQEEI